MICVSLYVYEEQFECKEHLMDALLYHPLVQDHFPLASLPGLRGTVLVCNMRQSSDIIQSIIALMFALGKCFVYIDKVVGT
jgi:hypothetical protein